MIRFSLLVDRQDVIKEHNALLLDRLEHIHRRVPKQFDLSHHSEVVMNAPRATNAIQRKQKQDKIDMENKRMQRRIYGTKATFDRKQFKKDATRQCYFSDQISKLGRRQKIQDTWKQIQCTAALKELSSPPKHVIHHSDVIRKSKVQRYVQTTITSDSEEGAYDEDIFEDGKTNQDPSFKLPPLYSGSLTVMNSAKVIHASSLFPSNVKYK